MKKHICVLILSLQFFAAPSLATQNYCLSLLNPLELQARYEEKTSGVFTRLLLKVFNFKDETKLNLIFSSQERSVLMRHFKNNSPTIYNSYLLLNFNKTGTREAIIEPEFSDSVAHIEIKRTLTLINNLGDQIIVPKGYTAVIEETTWHLLDFYPPK